MQAILSPLDNMSDNAGCEWFSLMFDCEFDSIDNVGEVSKIELLVFLMPMIISTDVEFFFDFVLIY